MSIMRCDHCTRAIDTDEDVECDVGTAVLCEGCRDTSCYECGDWISTTRQKESGMCAHCEWQIQL